MTTQYQAGHKLRDLKAHLISLLGDKIAKRMNCEMGSVQLILSPKHMGNGFNIMVQRYDADFLFEGFPFKEYDPAILFANVGAWLMDHDSERDDTDLSDPDIEIVMEDESSAEILINLEFEEAVKVIEDPNGLVHWNNKRWSIEAYEVYTAKKLHDVTVNHRA